KTLTEISIHESAHFVLTHVLCPTHAQDSISIKRQHQTWGRVSGESIYGIENITIKDVENEIVTLYAGYIAEVLICNVNTSIARLGARGDFEVAEQLLDLTNW